MWIGQLIFHLPTEKKQKIRRMEKMNKKISSVKSSLIFNRTCIKENLLPKYTNIYIETLFSYIISSVRQIRQDFFDWKEVTGFCI